MSSFIMIYSSLEAVKKRGFGRGGRGAFFYSDIFQIGRCAKTGDSVEGGGVPSFIMYNMKIDLPLIFWETIIPIKKCLEQKMCISMRSTTFI